MSFEELLGGEHEQFDARGELLKSVVQYANAEPAAASASTREPGSVPPGSDTPTDQEGQPFTEEEVTDFADALWRIEGNYHREGSGPGSRFEGERLDVVQVRYILRTLAEAGRLLPAGTEPLGYEVVLRNEHPALPPWVTDWDGKVHRTAATAAKALAKAQAAGYEGTVAALIGPWELTDEGRRVLAEAGDS